MLREFELSVARTTCAFLLWNGCAVVATAQASLNAHGKAVVSIKENEADRHLMGDWPDIRLDSSESSRYRPFDGIHFIVTVSDRGDVVDVELDGAAEMRPAGWLEGERVMMQQHFRPFIHHGRPVPVRFPFYLPVFPPEELPKEHVPFPELKDRSSLVITLKRWGCYGTCPVYKIQIHGDGTVDYDGTCFVVDMGHRTETIPAENVDELFDFFRKADYLSLKPEYMSPASDVASYETSIAFDGISKSVQDYLGMEMGMPDSVVAIEQAIDRLTNSGQWLNRNGRWKPKRKGGCG